MRRLRVGVLIVLVLLMLLVPQLGGDYYVHVFALVFTNVILAASLRPSLTCGQLNIGHSAFMSVGAYASALLAKNLAVPFEVSMLCGALLAAVVGLAIGYPSLRLRGVYFPNHKVLAFMLGCFFAGVAGAFYAHFIRFLFPPEFGFLMATNILVYNYVGGRGHFAGPIVGAAFLSLLSEPFRGSAYETIFFSIAMLLTILFLPGGLITLPGKLAELRWWKSASAHSPSPAA